MCKINSMYLTYWDPVEFRGEKSSKNNTKHRGSKQSSQNSENNSRCLLSVLSTKTATNLLCSAGKATIHAPFNTARWRSHINRYTVQLAKGKWRNMDARDVIQCTGVGVPWRRFRAIPAINPSNFHPCTRIRCITSFFSYDLQDSLRD